MRYVASIEIPSSTWMTKRKLMNMLGARTLAALPKEWRGAKRRVAADSARALSNSLQQNCESSKYFLCSLKKSSQGGDKKGHEFDSLQHHLGLLCQAKALQATGKSPLRVCLFYSSVPGLKELCCAHLNCNTAPPTHSIFWREYERASDSVVRKECEHRVLDCSSTANCMRE